MCFREEYNVFDVYNLQRRMNSLFCQVPLFIMYLKGINFRGDYISRNIIPRENFQTLWIHEILGFLPKSPRKMKEIR